MKVSNKLIRQVYELSDDSLFCFVIGGVLIGLMSIIHLIFPFEPFLDWLTVASILTAVAGALSLTLGGLYVLLDKVRYYDSK